jgi:hypothetical protein
MGTNWKQNFYKVLTYKQEDIKSESRTSDKIWVQKHCATEIVEIKDTQDMYMC